MQDDQQDRPHQGYPFKKPVDVLLGRSHLTAPIRIGNIPDSSQLMLANIAYVSLSAPALTSQNRPSNVGRPPSNIIVA
jgi:hypothetical protein